MFPPIDIFSPKPQVNLKIQTLRRNMEAHRSVTRRLQRKPLGDCTNTVSKTSQHTSSSSATVVKFANPSLTSSLKRLVDQTSIKEKIEDVNNLKVGAGSASKSLSTSVRPVTRRMFTDLGFPPSRPSKPKDVDKLDADFGSPSRFVSTRVRPTTRRISADLDFPASAPSRPRNSRSYEGLGDKEVAEPYSVYTVRRKASGKKKNKDASSSSAVASLRLDLISSPGKKRHQADEPKPSKVAPNKRQRTVKNEEDNVANGISEDYLAQQRAYFAEVDAFELAEEEVSSSDLD